MNQADAAETSRLSDAVRKILPALEDFNQFRKQDLAAFQRSTWMAALDQPLPESGAGLQQVLHELTETIIPYGFRNGSPGFSSYVTTAPTTAGTAAALAATVAGSQRWHVHPFNLELSAPSRGVQVWAILKEIGAKGMRERVIQHNNFARHLALRVEKDDRLELLAEPVLSICCFRYCPPQVEAADIDELNAKIVSRLRADGIYVPSTTRVNGKLAIRPCYINPRASISEVNGLVDQVREIGDSLLSR